MKFRLVRVDEASFGFCALLRRGESAVWDVAHGQSVHISNLPIFQTEYVRVGQPLFCAEVHQAHNCSHIGIDDIAPVDDFDAPLQWRPARTGCLGISFGISIRTPLQAGAWDAPGKDRGPVRKHIKIGIRSFNQGLTIAALSGG